MYYSQKVEQTIDDFRKQIVSLKSLDDFIAARKNIYRVLEQEINNDKNYSGIENHEYQFQRTLVDTTLFLRLANEVISLKKQLEEFKNQIENEIKS